MILIWGSWILFYQLQKMTYLWTSAPFAHISQLSLVFSDGQHSAFTFQFWAVFFLLLSFPLLTIYPNWSFFLCHFDECPGPFHRVQMWGGPDPSWFQESIGVHKGRVIVYLLPWCDTESTQKERQTDLKLGQRSCVCVRVCVCSGLKLCGLNTNLSVSYIFQRRQRCFIIRDKGWG